MDQLTYRISPQHPETHILQVECIIPLPDLTGQIFSIPVWIPGSYLIRDFSKHILQISANISGQTVPIRMLTKNTWICSALDKIRISQDPLIISYEVYAFDLTPRGAHVDNTHAFFNGCRVFIQVAGYEQKACLIEILKPQDPRYHTWRVATSLPTKKAAPYGFGVYQASNYEDLIDHPVEIGNFTVTSFKSQDVLHELVVIYVSQNSNAYHNIDVERLTQDLQKIVEHHIDFFGESAAKNRYVFLLTVFKDGAGGIEHKYSCVAHTSYDEMPKRTFNVSEKTLLEDETNSTDLTLQIVANPMVSPESSSKERDKSILPMEVNFTQTESMPPHVPAHTLYRNLLSLLSHEYFHAWHVKRIKPKTFIPYDLSKENYTRLLWLFEGITSYYDELALVRTKLITIPSYLEVLANVMQRVYSCPGRFKQTLEAASFEAWTKFYKPDENSRNATVSYYSKGALFGLCLDLLLRNNTKQRCSLDDIMRALWQLYGKEEKGLPEDGFEPLVRTISGCDLSGFFDDALRGTKDLPVAALLKTVGIQVKWHTGKRLEALGGRASNRAGIELIEILVNSAFEIAGLAPKDNILAINQRKVDNDSIEEVLSEYKTGDLLKIHAIRRDQLIVCDVTAAFNYNGIPSLHLLSTATDLQKHALEAWLKQPWNADLV